MPSVSRSFAASLALASLLATAFLLSAIGASGEDEGNVAGVDVVFGARIPLRDGAHLGATFYLPETAGRPSPTLFVMTPYGTDNLHPEAMALARRGFAVATVHVRGRGHSSGEFEPWAQDGRDGYDVVEWLAHQPWSSGKVGMWGHSYSGRAVWSTLKEGPPHLAAAVPLAPSLAMQGWKNILTPDTMQWILLTAGATSNTRLAADSSFWVGKYRELYFGMRPLAEMDRIVGTPSGLYQRFINHPTLDDYWSAVTPKPADFARIRLPILTVVGQHDAGSRSAFWFYREHHKAAGSSAHHQLLFGPWGHHGAWRPSRFEGGLDLGAESEIKMVDLLADWFWARLVGGPEPPDLSSPSGQPVPVRYYLLGPNEWRTAASLDEITAPVVRLFLDSAGQAGSLRQGGQLRRQSPAERGRRDRWTFDPRDLRPGRAEVLEPESWLTTLDLPDDLWGSGVAYTTAPWPSETLLSGEPSLTAWISLDTPDADFGARLDALLPDGQLILLGEDWVRARYRSSLERAEVIPPGVPLEYRFEFPFLARRLPAGSRVRIVLRSLNSIFQPKNFNAGGEVARESGKDARVVAVEVWHDSDHPSHLEIGLEP